MQCVQGVSEGATVHPQLESLLKSTPVRVRGTKFAGVYVGNPSYRQQQLGAAFRNVEKEVLQLQPYKDVTSQSKMVLFLKSIQHEFAHHLYSSVPSDILVVARRLDSLSREFVLNQADLDPDELNSVALPAQKLIIHLPQGNLGFGVVCYEDRVRAGSFIKSVTGMLQLLAELSCPWLQNTIKAWMAANSRSSTTPPIGSLVHGYRQVVAERKTFFAPVRDNGTPEVPHAKLPLNPAMLRIKGDTPSKQVYRELLKEIHMKRVQDLRARVLHVRKDGVEGRALQAWELHCQVKQMRGQGLPISVIPAMPSLVIKEGAYRRFITEVLGFAPFSLSESLLDRKCACYNHPVIDPYHCATCPILGQSAVHDAVKLMIGKEMGQARAPGTTVETEPRGAKCGRPDGDKKGPDLILSHPGSTHFVDFKSVNVVAATNRKDADKDLRLPRHDDDDDDWIDDAGSHGPLSVSQPSATTSASSRKRKKIKELCFDVRYKSSDAKYVAELGSTVTAVPITTTGVIHPNLYKILKEYIDKGDEFDDRYNFGWDCRDFRSYIFQRAAVTAVNKHGTHSARSVNVVARKFDVPLPHSPRRMYDIAPAPCCAMDDVQDDDEDFDQLQVDDDEQVTSFGVDVHQHVFPVSATTPGVVVDGTPLSATMTVTRDILDRVERIRYLSNAFLMAEQEWQDKHDIAAQVRRDQLRAELDALMSDSAPMGASAATTDSA